MRPTTPPSRNPGARPGSELPADRLLGPLLFFVLGVALAILGIRGAPTDGPGGPDAERGVAAPTPIRIEADAPARAADWVILFECEDPAPRAAAAPEVPRSRHAPG